MLYKAQVNMDDESLNYVRRGFIYLIYDYFSRILEERGRRKRLGREIGFLEKLAKR